MHEMALNLDDLLISLYSKKFTKGNFLVVLISFNSENILLSFYECVKNYSSLG